MPGDRGRRGGGEAAVRSTGALCLCRHPGGVAVAVAGGAVTGGVHFSLIMMGAHRLRGKGGRSPQCNVITAELRWWIH